MRPEALLECLEDAAERGIPLSEPSSRSFEAHEKDAYELRKGVTERRAPIGIAHPPPRQVRGYVEGDCEYDDYGHEYRPFPRLKRRREVIDLGPLPPRPWEVDGIVDTRSGDGHKGKNKGKGQRRGSRFLGWFGS